MEMENAINSINKRHAEDDKAVDDSTKKHKTEMENTINNINKRHTADDNAEENEPDDENDQSNRKSMVLADLNESEEETEDDESDEEQSEIEKSKKPNWPKIIPPDEPVIGIDLGTTYSCVYVCENRGDAEEYHVVVNDDGNRTTPSYVSFKKTEVLIGQPAKDEMKGNEKNTIFDVKRLIGLKQKDKKVQEILGKLPYVTGEHKITGKVMIRADVFGKPRWLHPEEILALLLLKLKTEAENYLGRPARFTVITVPEHFNSEQRNATISAGRLAGLTVIGLLTEPTAAALGYAIKTKSEELKYIMVFDLGGGTFDVTLLAMASQGIEVKHTGGNRYLGGQDFVNKMVDWCIEQVKSQFENAKFDPYKDVVSVEKIRDACEIAKRSLSTVNRKLIHVDGIFRAASKEPIVLRKYITPEIFNEMNQEYFDETIETVKSVLNEAKMKAEDVDEVVLVGGSSRIPAIRDRLSTLFGAKVLKCRVDIDEAVAFGAAIKAAIAAAQPTDKLHQWVFSDVVPHSLGVEYVSNRRSKMAVLIQRGKTMPISSPPKLFTPYNNYQKTVEIDVYEGESKYTRENNLLCSFTLDNFTKDIAENVKIQVNLDLDDQGILTANAKDVGSGREASDKTTISMDGGFTDAEMEEMTERLCQYFTCEYEHEESEDIELI